MPELGLQSREHLDLLYQASQEFNSTLDLDELLPRVFDRILESLDAEAGSIWLRDGEQLTCRLARGPVGERVEGLELPMGAGIVGDVALQGRAELVHDARGDKRFVHQVDEATGFETRSMVAAPLKAKDEVLGVLQVLNKRSGDGLFDDGDRALLEGLASTAGLALHNARLHGAERRARDLKTLLTISREITSTLDVDRLALSVVNLASQALAYDRAAIALDEGGRVRIHAISGQETLDSGDADSRELGRLVTWLLERGEAVYVADLRADSQDAESIRNAFNGYLERRDVRSLYLVPLQDEEGRLGGLFMESSSPDFLGESGREAAELLGHQTAIAIRNAELYGQVPFIGLLEPVAEWRRRLAGMPRNRLLKRVVLPVAVVLALIVLPWGQRITADDARLLPGGRMPVRATVSGLISAVQIEEGQVVEQGDVLAVLRDDEVRMAIAEAEAALAASEREGAAALARGDEAAARLAQIQVEELTGRLGLLGERLQRTRLRAHVAGTVLTLRPRERVGEWLDEGETFVTLGRRDRLEVEGRVAQRDIERVQLDQSVRLKVPARPDYTFVGRVTHIAPYADPPETRGEPTFIVRATLDNERGLLRPGMEARAKIVGDRRPLGYLILRPLVRWIQLRFWR